MQTQIQLIANLTHDPELRYTTSGKAYARIRLASTPRVKDASGTWVDGATTFYEGRAWNDLAEHATESLRRGDRVIVLGGLRTERWTDSTGEDREALRVDVDEIGPSLRFANAKVTKTQRTIPTTSTGHTVEDAAYPATATEAVTADAATDAVVRHLGGRPVDAPF
jgi:single-strand DNA-binding protein